MSWSKWIGALMAVSVLGVISASAAPGPQEEGDGYVRHDERDWEDEARYSLGLAIGWTSLDNPGQEEDVETYGTINFRIGFQDQRKPGGWRGHLEAELGYWESAAGTAGQGSQLLGKSDLLLGLNIVGVAPFSAGEVFLGAGVGVHFIDLDVRSFLADGAVDQSVTTEVVGVNAQFGVDLRISRRASVFGVGRADILDDRGNSLDAKFYIGLRFRLGGKRPDHWSPDGD